MRLFKSQPAPVTAQPAAPAPVKKPPVVEGWSESELVTVYNSAPVRHLKKGEPVFAEGPSTESFFVLLDGGIQIVVKSDGHAGRPGLFRRGTPLRRCRSLQGCRMFRKQSSRAR